MLYGIDYASWQGRPNFALLRQQGHDYAITKVTGEGNYVNPLWRDNHAAARKAGLIVGTYDWVEPQGAGTLTGAAAARDYLRVVGERQVSDLLCVDFESPDWHTGPLGRNVEAWMREYLYTLRDLAKQPVIVYSGNYFLVETGANRWAWLGRDFHYWQAAPGAGMLPDDSPWPANNAPFSSTLIHQHQWHARSAAIVGEFDRNRFRGTRAELAAFGLPGSKEDEVREPEAGKTVAYINARGETIVASNYGGEAVEVLGHTTVDQGVTVRNRAGHIYDQSLQQDTMRGWRLRPQGGRLAHEDESPT